MKALKHKQGGLTFISIAFILALIAFFTLLVLRIVPIYMDHGKVVSTMEALENTVDIEKKSRYEIIRMIENRFNIGYVDHIDKDDFVITKKANYVKIELEYETVAHIVGNLSVLVEFHELVEVGQE